MKFLGHLVCCATLFFTGIVFAGCDTGTVKGDSGRETNPAAHKTIDKPSAPSEVLPSVPSEVLPSVPGPTGEPEGEPAPSEPAGEVVGNFLILNGEIVGFADGFDLAGADVVTIPAGVTAIADGLFDGWFGGVYFMGATLRQFRDMGFGDAAFLGWSNTNVTTDDGLVICGTTIVEVVADMDDTNLDLTFVIPDFITAIVDGVFRDYWTLHKDYGPDSCGIYYDGDWSKSGIDFGSGNGNNCIKNATFLGTTKP